LSRVGRKKSDEHDRQPTATVGPLDEVSVSNYRDAMKTAAGAWRCRNTQTNCTPLCRQTDANRAEFHGDVASAQLAWN
jgi:hypothetical protein